MRQVFVHGLDREVSALGFGCASLGSRVSAKEGLAALDRAYERGVTWYDVAPPYGDGQAEVLLGEFLKGKRDKVAVCTKVGIAAPRLSFATRVIKPMARAALSAVPQLRTRLARSRPASIRRPITATEIESSIVTSLRRLGVDHVDVLALHDPSLEDVSSDEVLAALRSVVEKGYARMVGVAGAADVAGRGLERSSLYGMAQYPADPFGPSPLFDSGRSILRLEHSVFGVDGALARLSAGLLERPEVRAKLLEAGIDGPDDKLAATALMDYALANNTGGVILASMFKPSHLQFNCARADRPVSPSVISALRGFTDGRALSAQLPVKAVVPAAPLRPAPDR